MILTRTLIPFVLAFAAFTGLAHANEGDSILGLWLTPENDGEFEIYKTADDKYFGKILGGDGPERFDTNNPDPALQSRSLLGVDFLTNFSFDERKNEWVGGNIYDPDNGRTYDAKMWLDNKDATKLNARGFVGISAFGRTAVFTRVEDAAPQAGQ